MQDHAGSRTRLTRRQLIRGVAIGAGAVVGAEFLAACGPAPAVESSGTPAASAAASASAAARPFAGTALTGMFFDTTFVRGVEKLLPEFEAKTGIKLTMDIRGFSVFVQQADLELSSGTGTVDVMNLAFANSGRWMSAGWAEPLDDNIKKASFDMDDFLGGPLAAVKYKGKTFGIPMFSDSHLMMYRKDLISKPPATFDELLDTAAKVNSPQVSGYLAGGGTALNWTFPVFQMGFGGKPFANPPDDMTPLYDKPETIRAAEYWAGTLIKNYGVPGFTGADTGEIVAAASQGRAAIWTEALGILTGPLDPNKSKVADKIAYAIDPKGPAGWFPQVATHGMMIPAASKKKEAAWEFIRFATAKETMLRIALESDYAAAVRSSVLKNADFRKKYTSSGSDIPGIHEQTLANAASGYMAFRVQPDFPAVTSRVVIALTQIVSGQKSAKDAMTEANKDIFALLEKSGRPVHR